MYKVHTIAGFMMNKAAKRNLIVIGAATLVMLAVLCLCAVQNLRDTWQRVAFVVETAAGDERIALFEDGDTCYAFLPSYAELSALQLSVPEGCEITVDGRAYGGKGFFADVPTDTPLPMRMKTGFGAAPGERQLIIKKAGAVPALYVTLIDGDISSVNNSVDHQVSRAGRCSLITADGKVDYSGSFTKLRGRGNVTWEENKKPYNIEFKEPVELLGMGKGLRYCLLANALDKSHLRDKIVYDAAVEEGLPFSAESAFVDLYIDGDYLGLYLMTEDVQLRADRVNITDLSAATAAVNPYPLENYPAVQKNENGVVKRCFDIRTDPEDITGGYLVELDMAERFHLFRSGFILNGNDYCYTLKSPRYASEAELDYIAGLFGDIERDFAAGKLNDRIDVDSWVRYYLVQEVFANFDPCSVYFHKDSDSRNTKIVAGPIWDFDKALGSPVYDGTGSPNRLYAAEHTIFQRMASCSAFAALAKQTYQKEFVPLLETFLNSRIDGYLAQITPSAKMNELRWAHERLHSWETRFDSFEEHVSYVRDFLRQRRDWLDAEWLGEKKVTVEYYSYAPVQKIGFFTKAPGETVGELPVLSCEGYRFDGWFDRETDLAYDPNEVLTAHRSFIAKWTKVSSDGLLKRAQDTLEAFADRQNWTVEKLFNYALTGLLAGIFFLVLAVFFVVGLIKSRKRKGGKKR